MTGRDRLRELLDAVLDEENPRHTKWMLANLGDPINWLRDRNEK